MPYRTADFPEKVKIPLQPPVFLGTIGAVDDIVPSLKGNAR